MEIREFIPEIIKFATSTGFGESLCKKDSRTTFRFCLGF